VQAGDRALAVDALIVATMPALDLSSLQLEAVGVNWQPEGIRVTSTLQTTHPQIYACGEALGGYALPHVADYEAEIALKNSLLGTSSRVDYSQLPWSLFTSPVLTRIGLTEPQARFYYGDRDVVVLRQSLRSMSIAQICQETPGWGKLIVHRTGEIIGAHLLGGNADTWISPIALAMQHRIPLPALDRSAIGSTPFSTLLDQWLQQWQQYQATRQPVWKRWVGRFRL
jgi:pyruvate/2-oxoglutarate dehydrogenase complex dihydrolipoamide dehydrogenase (E3) component